MMKREWGFTLVEMLIGIAISGLIVGTLGTSIYQIVSSTEYGGDNLVATHELQNAAHWVGIDGQRAVEATGGGELVLTLPNDSTVTYSVVGTDLLRTVGASQMTLAQNISDISFSIDGRVITMNITSSPEGRWNVSKQGTYKVYLRPSEES